MNYKVSDSFEVIVDFWKIELKWGKFCLEFQLVIGLLALFFGFLYHHFSYSWDNSFFTILLGYSIPLVLVVHLFIWLLVLIFRIKSILLISLPLLLTADLVNSMVVFNAAIPCKRPELNVMNYNVGTFDLFRFHKQAEEIIDTTYEMPQVRFLSRSGADVICLQEFYNNDLVGTEAVINLLAKAGYRYYYTNPKWIDYSKGFYGLITFSKYPIYKSGSIEFDYANDESRIFNRGIYSDVIVQNDTVRIFNIHLHSMSLQMGEIKMAENFSHFQEITIGLYEKLKTGAEKRRGQVAILQREVELSPHPVLMCGDFNDLPSSFTYRYIRRKLNNVHESVGFGFGFTYNKEPWFIRIDNQFYDPRIVPKYSRVFTDNTLSDHFPLMAGYEIVSD